MNHQNSPADRIEAARQDTISVLENLNERAAEFELPKPPEALGSYLQKLRENTYQVLVVGEAKRGKSSFVNALIGRDILPTDVDVATSQVFRITRAEKESYRLRFEDDSTRPITLADLPRYGSQTIADQEGLPQSHQVIRWIEADVPASFIPKGVSFLDTPGLGTLYAAHAQITHRFVPQADAVIFVLDSAQPIIQDEINFIETLLGVTRNIFFIQTKIDQHGKEHWQEIQRRNEEILNEHFANRLLDARVWPISSANLRKAATVDDRQADALLMVARHKEMAAALRHFLFRVSGWSRAAEAVLIAEHYQSMSAQTLNARLNGLLEESKQKLVEIERHAVERKQQFESDWGERGKKRKPLLDEMHKITNIAKQSFREMLQPGGSLEAAEVEKIRAVNTPEEARRRGEEMTNELLTAVMGQWQMVCREAQERCAALLSPFLEEADKVTALQETQISGMTVRDRTAIEFEDLWWQKIKSARTEAVTAAGLTLVVSAVLVKSIVALSFLTPFAPAAILIAGIWGWKKGWAAPVVRELDNARRKLREHLTQVMHQLRQHFFNADLSSVRYSRVEEYFNELEKSVMDQLNGVMQQKVSEAQAEITRMQEQSKLDEEERRAGAERTREQLDGWNQLGQQIKAIMASLKTLEESSAASDKTGI
jgi:predicted GTPase